MNEITHHQDALEAQCCPLCNPGVCSPEVAEQALAGAHQAQQIVWGILKLIPNELIWAEVKRRECAGEI